MSRLVLFSMTMWSVEALQKDKGITDISSFSGFECSSDSDCQPDDDNSRFRCMDASLAGLSLTETMKNTCRLPGNGPKPNATCVCQDLHEAGNGGCFPIATEASEPEKLQYLLIGDCSAAWVELKIGENLTEQGFEVTRANKPSNAASVNLGVHCMDGWLPRGRNWDIISFSFGMHDVSHNSEHLTLVQYSRLLTKLTKRLVDEQKRTGAKLLFVNTLPVPAVPTIDSPDCETPLSGGKCLMPPRYDHEVVEHNQIAAKIIKDANAEGASIETLDLYHEFVSICGGAGYSFCKYQQEYNVHPSPEGNDRIGKWYFDKLLSMTGKQ